jgi:leader peptidase (prepilin peptidase)/N-methyltransferase
VVIAFFFLFGIVIGSFLNVCITRIPEEVSIVSPGSRCPRCSTPIKPYDNVPVFAWIWLRGKCRNCGLPISPMYPLVELTTGLLFVGCYLEFGISQATVKWLFFICLIIILTVTDLRVRLLPDVITWPGFAAGVLFSAFVPPNDRVALLLSLGLFHQLPPERVLGVIEALLGAAFGSLLLWGAAAIYKLVRGREGMGLGDAARKHIRGGGDSNDVCRWSGATACGTRQSAGSGHREPDSMGDCQPISSSLGNFPGDCGADCSVCVFFLLD